MGLRPGRCYRSAKKRLRVTAHAVMEKVRNKKDLGLDLL